MPAVMDFTWITAGGTATALTAANGYDIQRGVLGLDVAPRVLTFDDLVGTDGALMSNTRFTPRDVVLPILTRSNRVLNEIHTAAAFFQGPGTLRYSDGINTRELRNVYYNAGMEGDQSANRGTTEFWRKYNVMLKALDPWWHGIDQTKNLTFGADTAFDAAVAFDSAVVPFDGGSANPTLIHGDTFAYPVITLTGPMNTGATVGVAGAQFQLAAALPAGQVIVVDSTPGRRGPRFGAAGEVDWSLLTPTSRLFSLPVGTVSVIVVVTGSTGATSVDMSWSERHLTA